MIVSKSFGLRERAEHENKSKEKKIEQLRNSFSEFGAGTRAYQVRSQISEINRLQPQELKNQIFNDPYVRFIQLEKQSGKIILNV